jgi:Flp pilus assembly protein TadD
VNGATGRHVAIWVLACALTLAGCQSGFAPETRKQSMRQPEKGLVTATLASAAERSGDLVSAQKFYGQLIAEGLGSAQIYERRGEILLTMGLPREASTVFAAALEAGFDTVTIRRGYGRALAWLSEPETALVQYEAVLTRNPLDAKAMNGRGVALDMLGRQDAAQAQYRLALAQAPGDLAVQNNLAMSYALSGKAVEAVAILERINASGASTVQHRQNLALLYGLLGHTEKAQALASRDLPPEDVARNMATYATMQVLYDGQPSAAVPASIPATAAPPTPEPRQAASSAPPPVPAVAATAVPAPAPQPQQTAAAAEPSTAAAAAPVPAASAPPPTPAALPGPSKETPPAPAPQTPAPPEAKLPGQVRQPWVVDLGVFDTDTAARDAWQKLKLQLPEFAQIVHYLEPEGTGRRLLAGPFWSDESARGACAPVRGQGLKCEPRHASAVRAGEAGKAPALAGESQQQ